MILTIASFNNSWVFISLWLLPSIVEGDIIISSGIFKVTNNAIRFSYDKYIQIPLNKLIIEVFKIFYIYDSFNTQINRTTPPTLRDLIFSSLSSLANNSFKDPYKLLSLIIFSLLLCFLQLTPSFLLSTT